MNIKYKALTILLILSLLTIPSLMREAQTRPVAWQASVTVATEDSANKRGANFVCDGSDDVEIIQAAIDAAHTNGIGSVLLFGGHYRLDDKIYLPEKIKFAGVHHLAVWFHLSGEGGIELAGASTAERTFYVTLEDLTIEGTGTQTAINWTTGNYGLLRNIRLARLAKGIFIDAAPNGVGISCYETLIEHIGAFNVGTTIHFYSSDRRVNGVSANTLVDITALNGGTGIYIERGIGNTIIGGRIEGNEVGIRINDRGNAVLGTFLCNDVDLQLDELSKGIAVTCSMGGPTILVDLGINNRVWNTAAGRWETE